MKQKHLEKEHLEGQEYNGTRMFTYESALKPKDG